MSEKTARLSIPLLGFPRMLLRKVKALGTGNRGESEIRMNMKVVFKKIKVHVLSISNEHKNKITMDKKLLFSTV